MVARRVVVRLDRKSLQLSGEPFAGLEPGVGPGDTLRAVVVRSERAKLFQLSDGPLWMEIHNRSLVGQDGILRPVANRPPPGRLTIGRRLPSRPTSEIGRLTLQQPTTPALTHKLTVANLYLAAYS